MVVQTIHTLQHSFKDPRDKTEDVLSTDRQQFNILGTVPFQQLGEKRTIHTYNVLLSGHLKARSMLILSMNHS